MHPLRCHQKQHLLQKQNEIYVDSMRWIYWLQNAAYYFRLTISIRAYTVAHGSNSPAVCNFYCRTQIFNIYTNTYTFNMHERFAKRASAQMSEYAFILNHDFANLMRCACVVMVFVFYSLSILIWIIINLYNDYKLWMANNNSTQQQNKKRWRKRAERGSRESEEQWTNTMTASSKCTVISKVNIVYFFFPLLSYTS